MSIDFMFMNICSAVHVVHTATGFSVATFFDKHAQKCSHSVQDTRHALESC